MSNDSTSTFSIDVEGPYQIPMPDCCPGYAVEVDTAHQMPSDLRITFTHDLDCDVWKYIQ